MGALLPCSLPHNQKVDDGSGIADDAVLSSDPGTNEKYAGKLNFIIDTVSQPNTM